MPKHARLSASGAYRWLACTPSAKLEEQFPNESSIYAEEGTLAHSVCEITARYFLGELSEVDYENQLQEFSQSKYYTNEIRDCAVEYAKLIKNKIEGAYVFCSDAFAILETRVDFSKWVKNGFGTSDCVIVADNILEVVDFKFGKGVPVEAEDNPQMKLYALGAYEKYKDLYDIEQVRMTIFQPRLSDKPLEYTCGISDLLDWAETVVKPKAKLAYEGKGDFAPSAETCKFCRAKEQCRARAEQNLKIFDDSPDPLLISVDEAGAILNRAGDIQAWLSDLENLVTNSLMSGESVMGWKLVEGRSVRKFADEQKVVEAMKAAGFDEAMLYERKLLTLTQMEKDFGKKAVAETLSDLIIKPQGKPTLAKASDRRAEFKPTDQIMEAFDA